MLHDGNQTSRFALTIANPAQGNQYTGGGGGTVLVNSIGMANYNGLITTVQHRLSSSFSLMANHTWSKCLNVADAQGDYAGTNVSKPNNPGFDYGPCGSDYRNVENVVLITKSEFHLNRFASLLRQQLGVCAVAPYHQWGSLQCHFRAGQLLHCCRPGSPEPRLRNVRLSPSDDPHQGRRRNSRIYESGCILSGLPDGSYSS